MSASRSAGVVPAALCRSERPGRTGADDVTVLEAAGTAPAEPAAASLSYRHLADARQATRPTADAHLQEEHAT